MHACASPLIHRDAHNVIIRKAERSNVHYLEATLTIGPSDAYYKFCIITNETERGPEGKNKTKNESEIYFTAVLTANGDRAATNHSTISTRNNKDEKEKRVRHQPLCFSLSLSLFRVYKSLWQ